MSKSQAWKGTLKTRPCSTRGLCPRPPAVVGNLGSKVGQEGPPFFLTKVGQLSREPWVVSGIMGSPMQGLGRALFAAVQARGCAQLTTCLLFFSPRPVGSPKGQGALVAGGAPCPLALQVQARTL